jgi:hypothetical protein
MMARNTIHPKTYSHQRQSDVFPNSPKAFFRLGGSIGSFTPLPYHTPSPEATWRFH